MFIYFSLLFRKVTSRPYSSIPGNRSYRHTVCDVEVLVRGHPQRQAEVQDALGNAPLRRLVIKQLTTTTYTHTSTLNNLTLGFLDGK